MTAAQIVQVLILLVVAAAILRRYYVKRKAHDAELERQRKRGRFYQGDLNL